MSEPAPDAAVWADRFDDVLSGAALARGAIDTAYQPIVDIARGTVVGYEALARFPGFAERNPEQWFANARGHGCAAELEAAALRCALRHRRTLPANCFLTVNVSPDLLVSEPVRAVWREEAGRSGDLGGLVVELTEQAPIDSYAELEADLNVLRSAGALIAVDDAGAGYAGLQHLVRLRPSLIKIDRALIQDVDIDETKRALVELVGTFASRIDAWVLAEGIERAEELATLADLGVPLAQGYHLARPGPPWAGIKPAVALRLAVTAHPHRTTDRENDVGARTVRAALEPVPTVTDLAEAPGRFTDGPHLNAVVLLDELDRPVAVLESTVDLYALAPGMRVNVHTPLPEALERAVTRPGAQRFEPLLVTDAAGRYVGIARIERLITALTRLMD
ncbi:diguanylate phosphodiesterase [Tersicoccus phoenicis]|uniref:Diguanylate phosphodiesterase n=1 Tax=Tersicoccus phoenicis TaxID=554083 RepID=A0A1R1L7F9_9MICC|nr:EAL domain-containing protein [Tersicoccus phoenicis]OMH23477.1 diguanylate phosphodiesterase [Tersicoccus phoenicis]